jgi:hypothetical protein
MFAQVNAMKCHLSIQFGRFEDAAFGKCLPMQVANLHEQKGRIYLAQRVQALDLESGSTVLDLTRLQAGIYICEIQVDNKPVFAGKYILIK